MRKAFSLLLLFSTLSISHAQTYMKWHPTWSKGDMEVMEYAASFSQHDAKGLLRCDTTHAIIEISFSADSSLYYVLQWKFKNFYRSSWIAERSDQHEWLSRDTFSDRILTTVLDRAPVDISLEKRDLTPFVFGWYAMENTTKKVRDEFEERYPVPAGTTDAPVTKAIEGSISYVRSSVEKIAENLFSIYIESILIPDKIDTTNLHFTMNENSSSSRSYSLLDTRAPLVYNWIKTKSDTSFMKFGQDTISRLPIAYPSKTEAKTEIVVSKKDMHVVSYYDYDLSQSASDRTRSFVSIKRIR
jgi:hypothetical protein